MTRVPGFLLASAALACALAGAPALAAEGERARPAAPVARGIDPQAAEVLQRMSSFLIDAQGLRFHAEVAFDEVSEAGQKLQFAGALDVALGRPGNLFMRWAGDLGSKGLWVDGGTVTIADGQHRVFATEAAGPSLDATFTALSRVRGIELPLSELLSSNPYSAISTRVESGISLGEGDVDGVVCDHLAFRGENVDGQLWVQHGEQPLPLKVVLTYKKRPLAPQWAAVLSKWEIPVKLSAKDFAPQVPTNFQRIEFLKAARSTEGSL